MCIKACKKEPFNHFENQIPNVSNPNEMKNFKLN